MTRIGIYGGTFSPPHNGHLRAARAFMEQMWLDFLYVIPTAVPPHKEMEVPVSAQDRLEMCRLAFSGMEGVYVSDMEIQRGGRSYTVDTLRELSGEDRRLFLLCGTDGMLTLGERNDAGEIFKLYYPVYVRRESDKRLDGEIIAKNQEYFEKYGRYVIKLDTPAIEISSSKLRMMMRQGGDVTEFMDSEVLKYIENKGLYR